MIVVDTSALIAVAAQETDWLDHLTALNQAEESFISPINYVEAGIVLVTRGYMDGPAHLDRWLGSLNITVRHDVPLSEPALAAYLRYGKGVHPARLNLADTFAYALAFTLGLPLLFKGDDFALTDVSPALTPHGPPPGAGGR